MFKREELGKLNSMTKYPSIPTFHGMCKDGTLSDISLYMNGGIYGTEKVDGTNARIIVGDRDWVIGSREELLAARADRVPNMDLRIVEALEQTADRLANWHTAGHVWSFCFEVFGHQVGAAHKNYAKQPDELGFRLFDVQILDERHLMADWSRERIASWRDHGGQRWASVEQLQKIAEEFELDLVPPLFTMQAEDLPHDVAGMHEFMKSHIGVTRVALNPEARLIPEGIVIRTHDRRSIAKLRFQSYEHTMRKKAAK